MVDEKLKLTTLLMLLYLTAFISYVWGLWAVYGISFVDRQWWAWGFAVVQTGFRQKVEIEIFSALVGGLLAALLAPLWISSFLPWRLTAWGACKSAWANWADIWWLGRRYGVRIGRLRPGKVLGRDKSGRWVVITSPLYVLCFGPAGEGKTAGVLIPSCLNLPGHSLIVNDPAGEIAKATAGERSRHGRIIRLAWGSPESDGFNPLSRVNMPVDPVAAGDYFDTLAGILVPKPSGNSSAASDFFVNSARSTLSACMAYHYYGRASVDQDTSIGDVISWLSLLGKDGDPEDMDPVGTDLVAAVATAEHHHMPRRIIEEMNAFALMNRKTRGDMISTLLKDQLALWQNDYVRKATSHNTFSLEEITNPAGKPITIYLIVPTADQERFGKATGLFLEAFYTFVARSAVDVPRRRVTLILDELKFIPPLRIVKDGPSILRKFKVDGILGFQDLSQVTDVYDEATLSGFQQNVVATVVFTLGHLQTAEWLSKVVGNHWARKRQTQSGTLSPAQNVIGSVSSSHSEEAVPLLTPQDAMSLESGRHIVLFRSKPHRPLYARTPFYFKTRPFKGRSRRKPI